jgi:hypothetical protein
MQGAWSGCFQGCRGEAMHYLGYELPRIPILRRQVNILSEIRLFRKACLNGMASSLGLLEEDSIKSCYERGEYRTQEE